MISRLCGKKSGSFSRTSCATICRHRTTSLLGASRSGRIHSDPDGSLQEPREDVIRRLPKRYEQTLGCRFEGGMDLSGGEWQKIALARAPYFAVIAQLLVLDEPQRPWMRAPNTRYSNALPKLTKNRWRFLFSHRFSTVRMADRILVLENGQIAEEGSHERVARPRRSLQGNVLTSRRPTTDDRVTGPLLSQRQALRARQSDSRRLERCEISLCSKTGVNLAPY